MRPDFFHLLVGDSDTAVGPVTPQVVFIQPTQPIGKSMNHNIATRRHSASLRTLAVLGVWIRNVQSKMEAAAAVLGVDGVSALRRSSIAFPRLVPIGTQPERDLVGFDDVAPAEKSESACRLIDFYEVGL